MKHASDHSSTSGSVSSSAGRGERIRQRRRSEGGKRSRNDERCYVCHTGGLLILCDSCSASYHPSCIGLDREIAESMQDGWRCPICAAGNSAEDREGRLVRVLRRQAPVKNLWTSRSPMQAFSLEKYLSALVLSSDEPMPTTPEACVGGINAYPLVKSARARACRNGVAYVSKLFLDGGVRRRATDCERSDFLEYATDLAYLCSNICIYSSTMAEEIGQLGKQLLRRWTEMAKEEIKAISVDPHCVMSFAERVLACKRLGMYDDPTEGLSWERDIATLQEATEEADVATLVCGKKWSSGSSSVAPLEKGEYPSLCSNCGEDLGASRVVRWKLGRCLRCHWPVTKTVPYGDLVESLVWPSLYAEIGVPFLADSEVVFDTLRVIRRLRPYRHPQDIGLNAWKLQAYLITHVLYVLSEWGARLLSPTTLHYEYNFINEALTLCMGSIDDPELCGELVQCLRIFEAGGERENMSLSRRISAGVCYLLSRQSATEPGRWSRGSNCGIYVDYHTTMCVLLGLVEPGIHWHADELVTEEHTLRVQEWLSFMEDEEPHPYDQTFDVVVAATERPRQKHLRTGIKRKIGDGLLDENNFIEYTKIAVERKRSLVLAEAKKRDGRSSSLKGKGGGFQKDEKLPADWTEMTKLERPAVEAASVTSVRGKKGRVSCAICGCSFSRLCEAIRCVRCRLAVHRECLPRSQRMSVKKTKYCCPLCLMLDADDTVITDLLYCCLCKGPVMKGQYILSGCVFSSKAEVEHNKNFAHCPCAMQCILSEVDGIHLVHDALDGSVEFEILERFVNSSALLSPQNGYQRSSSSSARCCYCSQPLEPPVEACVLYCPKEGCSRVWHVGCHPPRAFLLYADEQDARAFRQHDCGAKH